MRFSHFFVDRPIFAAVISIVLTLIGGLAYYTLAVAQYPEVAPPTVVVSASYPGASAEVVAETVATPLEQQINGVENMLYMVSQSTGDGNVQITITFGLGTNWTRPRCWSRTGSRSPSRSCPRRQAGAASPPRRTRPT